jgi:hypothetical protein
VAFRMRTLAVIAGLAVAGLVAASAAQLDVGADDLGAGVDLVASCDTDGVDVAFSDVAYDQLLPLGPPGFAVMEITVSEIAFPACQDQWLGAGIVDGAGEQFAFILPVQITGTSAVATVLRPAPLDTCILGQEICLGASAEAIAKIGVLITQSNFAG